MSEAALGTFIQLFLASRKNQTVRTLTLLAGLTIPSIFLIFGIPGGHQAAFAMGWCEIHPGEKSVSLSGHIARQKLMNLPADIESLDLSGTDVEDADLKVLRSYEHLKHLALDSQVGDEGIAQIKHLHLESLSVENNHRITPNGFRSIGTISTLQCLSLDLTDITDDSIPSIGRLRQLENLELVRTSVSDRGLSSMRRLTRLQHLDLTGTQVTGLGFDNLNSLPQLSVLVLKNCPVSIPGLASVARLDTLERLDLSFTPVTDAGLEQVARSKNLVGLWLEGTKITDRGIENLLPLKELRYLDAYFTLINDGCIDTLQRLGSTRYRLILYLYFAQFSQAGIDRIHATPRLFWPGGMR